MKELASPSTLSGTKRHNYMIIQEATYFEYPATLCTVHRSREYYDCVWRSHVRVAAPAEIYQKETVPVEQCAMMYSTGYFQDVVTDKYRKLNPRIEIDYFYSAVVGEMFYSKGHSYCKGYPGSIGHDPIDQLLVTESLTVVMKKVTI